MIDPATYFYLVIPAWLIIRTALCAMMWRKTSNLSKGNAVLVRALSISITFTSYPFSPDHRGYGAVLMPLWAIEPLFRLKPDYKDIKVYFAGFTVITVLMLYLASLTRRVFSQEIRC